MSLSDPQVYPSLDLKPASTPAAAASPKAYEIKGLLFSILAMRLKSAELKSIEAQLLKELAKLPDFFREPLVLDLQGIEAGVIPDFVALITMMRGLGVAPFGVCNGNEAQRQAGQSAGLAVLEGGGPANRRVPVISPIEAPPAVEVPPPVPVAEKAAAAAAPAPTHIVQLPVRAGQRIFATEGDLTLLDGVNSGAEVLAVGSIHAYGPLRGRALAGVGGDTRARIFTRCMEAELVSIAGCFRVLEEDLGPEIQGKPAQIYLDGERIVIAAL